METNYAKSAYRTFLFWGVCSSLGVTVSTLVDATLVGNFIGSTGLAVANIATPVFLLYLLMGITLGGGAGVLIGKKLGEADLKGANRVFGSVLSAGLRRKVGEISGEDLTQSKIMDTIAGGEKKNG